MPSSPLLVGISTKMYFDLPTTLSYIKSLSAAHPHNSSEVTLFVIPSFPALVPAKALLNNTPHILLGAQDCHWEDTGPFTGSVSPLMLGQAGCTVVELGHAERRAAPFNETDEMVARKARAVMRNPGMVPLVCIGERERSRSVIMSEGVGIAVREVLPQVEAVLGAVEDLGEVWLAYEPVWAIGAQEPASADHVVAVVREVKRMARERRKGPVRVLYGGSAGPGTWEGLKEELDGLFLGRFGHDLENVKNVMREMGSS